MPLCGCCAALAASSPKSCSSKSAALHSAQREDPAAPLLLCLLSGIYPNFSVGPRNIVGDALSAAQQQRSAARSDVTWFGLPRVPRGMPRGP
eukprot:1682424-Rhodomonas_salina.4